MKATAWFPSPLVLLAALVIAQPASALEDGQILPGAKRIAHVSLGKLKGRCSRSGGGFIETSEEYGCATDKGWVYCEKGSGDCVGSRGDGGQTSQRRSHRMNGPASGRELPATARPRSPGASSAVQRPGPARALKRRPSKAFGLRP